MDFRSAAPDLFIAVRTKQTRARAQSVDPRLRIDIGRLTLSAAAAGNCRPSLLCKAADLICKPRKRLCAGPGANLYTFQYSKFISAIAFAAALAGLQNVITAPVQARTTCRIHLRP